MAAITPAAYTATSLWHMKPRAVQNGDFTYFAYHDYNDQDIMVATYTSSTDSWARDDTSHNASVVNAHASPCINIKSDGKVIIFVPTYNTNPSNFLLANESVNSDDPSSWAGGGLIYGNPTPDNLFTYPLGNINTSDELILIYTPSVSGARQFNRIKSGAGGTSWANDITLINKLAAANSIPYVQTCMAGDRLYVVWDQYNGTGLAHQNLYMVYSDDPAAVAPTWKSMDGTTRTAPFSSTFAEYGVLDSSNYDSVDWDNCYIGAMMADGVDGSSVPHIVFGLEDSVETNRLMHGTWNGSSWDFNTVEESNDLLDYPYFSGPICDADILVTDSNNIAIVTPVVVSGQTEIVEFVTVNGGTDWDDPGTQLSDGLGDQHIQPTYPLNNDATKCKILWLTGANGHYNSSHDINGFVQEDSFIPNLRYSLNGGIQKLDGGV